MTDRIVDLSKLELPNCEKCNSPSKKLIGRTMDVEGPGKAGVLFDCHNKKCRARRHEIGRFIVRMEAAHEVPE